MSRLFDALQRSGTEQSGVEYPDMVSVAKQVFESPLPERADPPGIVERIPIPLAQPSPVEMIAKEKEKEKEKEREIVSEIVFPSLQVSIAPSMRLVSFDQPDSLAAEKFRFLGVRLRQLRQSRTLKKILITSTIPEEGKSLVSANLANVLARRKEKVLLLEGDLRRPVLAQQFGVGTLAGLGEWLRTGLTKISNIYLLEELGLHFMPAGRPPENALELIQSGKLSLLMEQLCSMFDWVIVDSPPLLPLADTTVWARLTDGALIVVREEITEKKTLEKGIEILKKSDLLGVVLNSSSDSNHRNYYQRYTAAKDSAKS